VLEAAAQDMTGITVSIRRIMLAEPFGPVPGSDKLAEAFQVAATEAMGEPVPTVGIPLYTDARHYSAAGIPTVLYGAGPHSLLEANGHRADEKLVLEDLRKATIAIGKALGILLEG
jgi:acetylornithine deacetylase/succinyl-diaminopimelate desuccinylase-like protein